MSQFTNIIGGSVKLNTNYYLPMIGLGTYKITGQETITAAVDGALKSGYRMFDTAKYYKNEPELGNAFMELLPKYSLERKDIFITTKFFPAVSNNRDFARKMVDESLQNLKTDYLDLVLIHYPKANDSADDDPNNSINRKDAYLELEILKEESKVRSVGVSNYESRHIEEIKSYGKMMPAVNQVEFHPHFTRNELFQYCRTEGVFFQALRFFNSAILITNFIISCIAYSSLARHHPDLIGDPVIQKIASLLLLAWPLAIGVGIVPKSQNPSRVMENIKAVEVRLSDEEVQEIMALNKDKNYIRCVGWLVL
ncbi:unnamed protein product [Dracunculus medinensis]|uniref:Aldo_ket_red domain-containing protein n=1 Tax=Dracunculus medinensis TaxID=318479 RepID=A0A158Q3U9_DRAME|nr:unnamed protein product [Dracunculus medinensis]